MSVSSPPRTSDEDRGSSPPPARTYGVGEASTLRRRARNEPSYRLSFGGTIANENRDVISVRAVVDYRPTHRPTDHTIPCGRAYPRRPLEYGRTSALGVRRSPNGPGPRTATTAAWVVVVYRPTDCVPAGERTRPAERKEPRSPATERCSKDPGKRGYLYDQERRGRPDRFGRGLEPEHSLVALRVRRDVPKPRATTIIVRTVGFLVEFRPVTNPSKIRSVRGYSSLCPTSRATVSSGRRPERPRRGGRGDPTDRARRRSRTKPYPPKRETRGSTGAREILDGNLFPLWNER